MTKLIIYGTLDNLEKVIKEGKARIKFLTRVSKKKSVRKSNKKKEK